MFGTSAIRSVRICTSQDGQAWSLAASLNDLPTGCPQTRPISHPVMARYLKLEVLSLAEGSGVLRSFEIETYLNQAPSLPTGSEEGKAKRGGFPNADMMKPALGSEPEPGWFGSQDGPDRVRSGH